MLHKAIVASALLLAWAAPAHAEYLYQGYLKFTAAGSACTKGPKKGTVYQAQYHPASLSGATQDFVGAAINIYQEFSARSWRYDGDPPIPSGGFGKVSNTLHTGKLTLVKIGTNPQPTSINLTAMTPSTLTTANLQVTLSGIIKNPFGLAGQESCKANFVLNAHRIIE